MRLSSGYHNVCEYLVWCCTVYGGFLLIIRQTYGANKEENINYFTSSMPIVRVNSHHKAFFFSMAGCRHEVSVNNANIYSEQWRHVTLNSSHFTFIWEQLKDICMIGSLFVVDVTPSWIPRGCFLYKSHNQHKEWTVKRRSNAEARRIAWYMWYATVWTYMYFRSVSVPTLSLAHTFALSAFICASFKMMSGMASRFLSHTVVLQ